MSKQDVLIKKTAQVRLRIDPKRCFPTWLLFPTFIESLSLMKIKSFSCSSEWCIVSGLDESPCPSSSQTSFCNVWQVQCKCVSPVSVSLSVCKSKGINPKYQSLHEKPLLRNPPPSAFLQRERCLAVPFHRFVSYGIRPDNVLYEYIRRVLQGRAMANIKMLSSRVVLEESR